MAVIIFGFWNVPVIRNLINPLKLFTIGWHELCHIIVVSLFSAPSQLRWIKTLFIGHPDRRSNIEDNDRSVCWRSHNCGGWYSDSDSLGRLHRIDVVRWSIILAGYTSLVAKIMSFVLGIGLLMPLALVRDKL